MSLLLSPDAKDRKTLLVTFKGPTYLSITNITSVWWVQSGTQFNIRLRSDQNDSKVKIKTFVIEHQKQSL